MAEEPFELAARRLLAIYQEVSLRGHYANYDEIGQLVRLCAQLDRPPPHQGLVASELASLFETIQDKFDQLAHDPTKWGILDSSVLEAICYLAKNGPAIDATRIVSSLKSARRAWCGE